MSFFRAGRDLNPSAGVPGGGMERDRRRWRMQGARHGAAVGILRRQSPAELKIPGTASWANLSFSATKKGHHSVSFFRVGRDLNSSAGLPARAWSATAAGGGCRERDMAQRSGFCTAVMPGKNTGHRKLGDHLSFSAKEKLPRSHDFGGFSRFFSLFRFGGMGFDPYFYPYAHKSVFPPIR